MSILQTIKNRLSDPTSKELALGSLFFFITKVAGIALTYLLTWWVSQKYGASKWGVYAFCFSILNILTIVCTLGFDTILIKYVSEYNSKKAFPKIKDAYYKMLRVTIPLISIVSLFLIAFPTIFCQIFLDGKAFEAWIQVIGFTLPAYVLFQINNSGISGLKNMLSYGIFKNIFLFGCTLVLYFTINRFIAPYYFQRFEQSGILILLSFGITAWLGALLNTIYFFWKGNLFGTAITHSKNLKEIIKESFPLFLTASIFIIITSIDLLMLSFLKSTAEVGVYDICVKISIATGIILMAVNAIATPKFSEYYANQQMDLLKQSVSQSTKLIFCLSIPILTIIFIWSSGILSLFGEEFIVGSTTLIILAIGQFINAMCGSVGNLLKMTNNQLVFQNILIGALGINILLNLLLIPDYGIVGAAIASTVCLAFWNFVSVYYAKKKLNILTIYIPFIK